MEAVKGKGKVGTVRRMRRDEKKAARVEAADEYKLLVSAYLDWVGLSQVLGLANRPVCSIICGCRQRRLNLKRLQKRLASLHLCLPPLLPPSPPPSPKQKLRTI